MIYGIEESSDMRARETKIKKFRSLNAAVNWKGALLPGYAWPGAADPDLPMGQQNFHRRHRDIFKMPSGWRVPRKEIEEIIASSRHSIYADNRASALARLVRKYGKKVV